MDVWLHLKCLMKIKRQALHNDFSSRATWRNLSGPSLIGQMRLNSDNSHFGISSKPLIEVVIYIGLEGHTFINIAGYRHNFMGYGENFTYPMYF